MNTKHASKKPKRQPKQHTSEKTGASVSLRKRLLSAACAVVLIVTGVGCCGAGLVVGYGLYAATANHTAVTDPNSKVPLPGDIDDGSVTARDDNPDPVNITSVSLRGNTSAVTNVMLIGIDGRYAENYEARSDTNIILSANKDTKTIKMVSLLRDTWVTVPGLDTDGNGADDTMKLNAAFYYGGYDLLRETIKRNYMIDIPKYIAVDFRAFEKAVDALGGIDVDLTAAEARFIPKNSDDPDRFADNPDLESVGNEAGRYHLNGKQALAYCRIRTLYADSDFSRQSNQRKVIDQLIQKARKSNFVTLAKVIDAILPYVETNMTQQELLDYAMQAVNYVSYDIQNNYAVPDGFFADGKGDFIDQWVGNGLGLRLTDPNRSVLELHQYLYNIPEK
ncbi:MAG: LCP family protein [Clostridia bacterium]|nr:LCP family protein [Clostridia bacterium]